MQGRLADPAHGIVICKVVPHERHAGRRGRRRVGGLAVLRRLCKSTIETRAVFLGDGAAVLARSRGERTGVPSKAPQTLICALFLARRCWLTIIDIAPPTQLSLASGVSVGVQACRAASRKLWSWCRRRRVGVLSTVSSRSSSTAPGGGVTSWAAAHQHHSAAAHSGRVVPRMSDRIAALLRADRSSGSPFALAAPRPRSRLRRFVRDAGF